MSEIKFACPHCQQHIACDSDYADLIIVCPACEKPMEVPILSPMDASHPPVYVVAAIPAPRQKFRSRVPLLNVWTEDSWSQHCQSFPATSSRDVPLWHSVLMVVLLSPFIVLGVLFLGCTVCR